MIPVVVKDGFDTWRLGAYVDGLREVEILVMQALHAGASEVGVHYTTREPVYYTGWVDMFNRHASGVLVYDMSPRPPVPPLSQEETQRVFDAMEHQN